MLPSGYTIRSSRSSDLPLLPDIERDAMILFADWMIELGLDPEEPPHVNSLANFMAAHDAGRLWVAADHDERPVGFALVLDIDGAAHLEELDVLPEHGRRGIGAALVDAVCDWARQQGREAVTLSTFRRVPWNEPFYARLGFEEVEASELTPGLARIPEIERGHGLRVDLRVVMRKNLGVRSWELE